MSALMTVDFHGAELMLLNQDGQPYVPMRPVADGMGIDWKSQHRKLAANQRRWGMVMMTTVAEDGKDRQMACIPLRKLPGWLASLEAGRIKSLPARQKIELYQEECDDALWQYWNDGVAVNKRAAGADFAQGAFKEFQVTRVEGVKLVADMAEQGLRLADMYGLDGNQRLFYADRLVRKQVGVGPMELLGLDSLPSSNDQVACTPKQFGERFGVSAQAFNKLLHKCGLQVPVPKGQGPLPWRPTEKGKPFSVMRDTNRQHNSGAPVLQLVWKESVLDELRRASAELNLLLDPVTRG